VSPSSTLSFILAIFFLFGHLFFRLLTVCHDVCSFFCLPQVVAAVLLNTPCAVFLSTTSCPRDFPSGSRSRVRILSLLMKSCAQQFPPSRKLSLHPLFPRLSYGFTKLMSQYFFFDLSSSFPLSLRIFSFPRIAYHSSPRLLLFARASLVRSSPVRQFLFLRRCPSPSPQGPRVPPAVSL